MKRIAERIIYYLSTVAFGLLAILFLGVMMTSWGKNMLHMWKEVGWDWKCDGNYLGFFAGFAAYGVFLLFMIVPRMRHNLRWFMKFTHELTHTLVAVCFWAKIREFVVRDRECYVNYKSGPIGYVPITLSPYCIPIYTFMLFPFRFVGDSHYMIVFDVLIAFTYAFHVHSFIKHTRYTQSDIEGCGLALSTTFISFVHLCVLSLILAVPNCGVFNALHRVLYEYPVMMLTNPSGWLAEVVSFF